MSLTYCSMSNSNSIIPLQHCLRQALSVVQAHADLALQVQESDLPHGRPHSLGCLQRWDDACAEYGPCLSSAHQVFGYVACHVESVGYSLCMHFLQGRMCLAHAACGCSLDAEVLRRCHERSSIIHGSLRAFCCNGT